VPSSPSRCRTCPPPPVRASRPRATEHPPPALQATAWPPTPRHDRTGRRSHARRRRPQPAAGGLGPPAATPAHRR
jgi:hypothetical protein